MSDLRRKIFKESLSQLTMVELMRLRGYSRPVCLDSYNYDEVNKTYCPLAVASGVDLLEEPNMTNQRCAELIESKGIKIYGMYGVPGAFYKTNRYEDMIEVVDEILNERKKEYVNTK